MRIRYIEILVGLFMLMGMLALLILALKVSGLSTYVGKNGYEITASFDNVGDLKIRAPVAVAGVRIGEITHIRLDSNTFRAVVTMNIYPNEKLPVDTSASILTQGLLGANYIGLIPGYEQTFLREGGHIQNTHPALILEDLIGQLIFSLKNSNSSK